MCDTDLLQISGMSSMSIPFQQPTQQQQQDDEDEAKKKRSDILDATTHELRLEKSNILMLGPTGSGTSPQNFDHVLPQHTL
jgi:ATP-dependent Clp protease ATP-binding subunit ClpX